MVKRFLPLKCVLLILVLTVSLAPRAAAENKTVRIGWYESSFNITDASGRRSGYAYEYQMKLAAYTGWSYEYVYGSWPELLIKLENGELDLLSDVSYTEEREKRMLFPDLPMGTEEYFLFIAPNNQEITPEDYSTLNGKRVGVAKGSVQKDLYLAWEAQNGVQTSLVEILSLEKDSLRMLETGELDAFVTQDSFTRPSQSVRAIPVYKIGSSDFYFAVNKDRPDILEELNLALNRIQDENRFYNQRLFDKYFNKTGANAFLNEDELRWLGERETIRVGYQDNYLAFCAADKTTGQLTGVLKDYLEYASGCIANASLAFEAAAYPTAQEAMEAMERGEVDCVFPANFSGYDAEMMNVVMTPPLMTTEIYAVVRAPDAPNFAQEDQVTVAVNDGNPNYHSFLREHFPSWEKTVYPTTEDCLRAVSAGAADCVLISNFRYNNIGRLCEKYRLTTLTTGVEIDYCIAVGHENRELYSILAKAVNQVPKATVNAAFSYYVSEEARLTPAEFIADHLPAVAGAVLAGLSVILFLLVQNMRAVKKAKKLISATETDELTGLYNRNFFFQYANRMYREHPDTPMDAIVMNIEQFHSVNALKGRGFGDRVLRELGKEIQAITKETGGIAGRFEADRFEIYCRHTDDYQGLISRLQNRMDGIAQNVNLRVRMGVMPWQKGLEPVQLFDMARTACSMARGHYKKHLIVFDDQIREREIYENRLLNDLHRALAEKEFVVFYQPKYDIQSTPPRLVSAEALVRWNHHELGLIPPDDFIPLFERHGKIGEVDLYVWTEAACQIIRWRERYGVTVPLSVNLSRVDIFDPTLEKTLDGILNKHGLRHSELKLEVTESAYTENARQVIEVIEGLREKGYEVEMDDFGTGYSSLNMLSAMPIDVLKMDKAFIQNIEHEKKDIQLVSLILGIARNLNIPVVAEGVETEEQMLLLKELGCAIVQGYYFSRPLNPKDFSRLIEAAG